MRTLLQHQVREQALAQPNATALVWGDTRLTYGELEEMSNRLANLLVDIGTVSGDRIGLLMPKRPMAIVGLLAILKAGAAAVPMDPGDPGARLARTLAAADCRLILGAGHVPRTLEEALTLSPLQHEPLLGWLDPGPPGVLRRAPVFELPDIAAFPAHPPTLRKRPELAQILFTSGSTGVPKGVMITHEGVAHFLRWANAYFGISGTDRISQHAPLRFDISMFDIFGALWSGAELHLVPPELNVLPHRLAQLIRDSALTQWFSVPAVLNLLAKFDAVRHHDFPDLRRVLFAGEVLPTPTLMYLMQRLPHVSFTNLYGPTETTISSSYHTIPRCPEHDREPIPIGSACEGEELLVLDQQLQPVAPGEEGDLYIGGVGLSPGYWRDPEKTRAAFIQDPRAGRRKRRLYRSGDRARFDANGHLLYCGRSDMQIKSRGYRIELGEIETALHTLPQLLESAVVAVPSTGFEGVRVCCAYVPVPGADAAPEFLRECLASRLPGFMLPAAWMRYEALPRTGSGKLDRVRLAEAFHRVSKPDAGIAAATTGERAVLAG